VHQSRRPLESQLGYSTRASTHIRHSNGDVNCRLSRNVKKPTRPSVRQISAPSRSCIEENFTAAQSRARVSTPPPIGRSPRRGSP
jgi:hypothetical protein